MPITYRRININLPPKVRHERASSFFYNGVEYPQTHLSRRWNKNDIAPTYRKLINVVCLRGHRQTTTKEIFHCRRCRKDYKTSESRSQIPPQKAKELLQKKETYVICNRCRRGIHTKLDKFQCKKCGRYYKTKDCMPDPSRFGPFKYEDPYFWAAIPPQYNQWVTVENQDGQYLEHYGAGFLNENVLIRLMNKRYARTLKRRTLRAERLGKRLDSYNTKEIDRLNANNPP